MNEIRLLRSIDDPNPWTRESNLTKLFAYVHSRIPIERFDCDTVDREE